MTKKLLSNRISAALDYISAGPTNINLQEVDTADLIGFDIDTLYEDSPFSFDTNGHLTSKREGVCAQTLFKDTEGVVGFRLADTTNNKEVLVSLEDDYFIIYENRMVVDGGSGVLGETADWKERFNISLHGDSGDTPGQDILNHLRMPTFIDDGSYLRGNTDTNTIEWASFDAATPDSCGIKGTIGILDCLGYGTWRNVSTNDGSVHVTKDWDNASMVFNVDSGAYDYIEIQTDGIYSIVMTVSILQSQAGASNGYRGGGYQFNSGNTVNKSERHMAFDFLSDTHQVFTGSWVASLDADDKLYPKLNQTNSSAYELDMYFEMAVTKISEE